jgi:hypothetical protein
LARAIKAGRMSASRRDDGGYLVNVAELDRVFGPLNGATVAATGDAAHHAAPDVTALVHRAELAEQRLADLKVMLEEMKSQRDDVLRDRDHWRTQAERLALRGLEPEKKPEKMTPWSWMPGPSGI